MTALPVPLPPTDSLPPWRRWLRARSKTALLLAALVGLLIFWCLGALLAIPAEPNHDGSLLAQPTIFRGIIALLAAALGLGLTTAAWRTLLGRGADPLLTLFAAAAGLAALSWRGGNMTDILQGSAVWIFPRLMIEQLLLAGLLLGCWWGVVRYDTGKPPRDAVGGRDPLLALLVTAAVMAVCVWLLAATDSKKQVTMAVGVGGFAGAAVTYGFLEIDAGLYYAAAPLLLGVFGYVVAFLNPGVFRIGVTGQPLAFPLPLDYASAGIVGSLLGFWTAQAWRLEAM